MAESQTVVDFKNQFDKLTSSFLNIYMKLETTLTQQNLEHTNQILETNKHNESLTELLQTKETSIKELEETVSELEKKNAVLEKKANDKSTLPEETSENKFDIIRGQAKEIAAKDKEIVRLTEEYVKLTDEVAKLTDEVSKLTEEKNKLKEEKKLKPVSGWSPTSSASPMPKKTPEDILLDDNIDEGGLDADSEEEEYEEITYRKTKYFVDSKQKVYEIIKDEDGDDDVGECIGDWIQQTNGKHKLVKH